MTQVPIVLVEAPWFLVLCLFLLFIRHQRWLRASHTREKECRKQILDLLEKFTEQTALPRATTANLERSNDTVHGLLAEKRVAWGLERTP